LAVLVAMAKLAQVTFTALAVRLLAVLRCLMVSCSPLVAGLLAVTTRRGTKLLLRSDVPPSA